VQLLCKAKGWGLAQKVGFLWHSVTHFCTFWLERVFNQKVGFGTQIIRGDVHLQYAKMAWSQTTPSQRNLWASGGGYRVSHLQRIATCL
jgi:hypothetical protein